MVPSESVQQHRSAAAGALTFGIITVSDTRTLDDDTGGALIAELLQGAGHSVAKRAIVADDPERIVAAVLELVRDPAVDVVLTTGGTGIARRDVTYEAVCSILDRQIAGFGELFRILSWEESVPPMLSRATAGAMVRPQFSLARVAQCDSSRDEKRFSPRSNMSSSKFESKGQVYSSTPSIRKPSISKDSAITCRKQMILRQMIIGRFRDVFELHGFDPLETPHRILEVLTGKAGENEKLMYAFEDHGGRSVGLRTISPCLGARGGHAPVGDRLSVQALSRGPGLASRSAAARRFREFWHCDADIAGVASMAADAEIISVLVDALAAVGLDRSTVHLSHRRLLERIAVGRRGSGSAGRDRLSLGR